ncbi:uncharacterized protein IUM83_00424 [Phytophthora cinnamomi]|uniref:uncharacterized protein n=1 Tax=Phytophthora cinnamomi TaxID=4785 RepID=UPI00355A33F8|nr:hypothetical protein IUM83_00424 [Phytophthora cinnamomi]
MRCRYSMHCLCSALADKLALLILRTAHQADPESTVPNDSPSPFAEKMLLPPGILRLGKHDSGQGISILFSSGRIINIDKVALSAMVSAVLPKMPQNQRSSSAGEPWGELRVRNLLHRIAEVSTESTALCSQSKQMDHQLKTLHSALEMLRVVKTAGVEAVVKCDLRASIVTTGNFSSRQSVKLVFSLQVLNPEAVVSSDLWWLCVYVRTRKCAVTSYSFPLEDVLATREQSIILDPDTIALQDQGALWVSCSLMFCPSKHETPEIKQGTVNTIGSAEHETSLSFAIPLLQGRSFLFAQLSQPVEDEIPVSQVAIQAAFRQSHDPIMPLNRAGHTDGEKMMTMTTMMKMKITKSCRTQQGKMWTVLRTLSGNLILLRFTPSEDEQRSVDLTIQCSDVADLSAMRALVLEAINSWSVRGARRRCATDLTGELALDMSELLEPIAAMENILEDLKLKTMIRIEDPESAICADEVLHALSQLARVETQTLMLYWKTRLEQ